MERLIRYGNIDSIPYYNCSWRTSEEWDLQGLKRPILGWFLVLFGGFVEILYLPILYIIFKTKLIRYACYKLIVFLTLTDMSATVCSSIISGVLYIKGSVFCSYPTFEYIAGGFAINTWCMACAINISLFANRVCSIAFHEYIDVIEGKLTYFCITISAIYGTFILFYTPIICFNSKALAWIPEPLSEIDDSKESEKYYNNDWQSWNNYLFVAIMFFLYITYCVLIKKLAHGQKSKKSRAIFIQCCIICFFNTATALIYNALSLMTPALWILYLGQLSWSLNHGCPAIIYLTMNDTIRKNFFRTFCRFKNTKIDTTNSGQVARPAASHVI
ncbi:Serpentine Receptor, class T [Caenorhabditis elegans]|uniref:Serpentine Receptor, class T n=1 Tax=Caenorhabditis elegans TaxID=6239 RepID=Q9NAI0_CAEEL|nr:Serpentine Receptor, class T [Caenorhabditis elegans]CAB76730.2 Serpentine Receptor, class T [Caenorhabditis elegans]|eukprot:NP_502822.2 Serpentine Receptor, class T [Caenorhabditis elegans]